MKPLIPKEPDVPELNDYQIEQLTYIPYGFDAVYKDVTVSEDNWMNTDIGRSRVYGEYLRICYLGQIGHILPFKKQVVGLDKNVEDFIKQLDG